MTSEHLNSVFLGGNREDALKKETLDDYVAFINKWMNSELSENQKRLFHSLKLAAVPKSDDDVRVIMMLGIHSKMAFSLFAASDLEKAIENGQLKRQCGTKSAGAETVIRVFQQTMEQNPNFDVFSADAIKAFYNLNRDKALKRLKEVAPQRFILSMDKRNNASNAFFFGLSKGVASFTQSEGGSPGSPEMSFLCELGISEFVKSIDDLMIDSNASQPRKGVASGHMDDLQWAAPFERMAQAIKFVRERGPDYGYNLYMDKSIYLMAPIGRDISQDELFYRVNLLMTLGVPIQSIKVHPQRQSFVSPTADFPTFLLLCAYGVDEEKA